MKILHVWDIGGDSYIAAKYQQKLGHESDVIKNSGFNPYGLVEFYGGKEFNQRFWVGEFYTFSILKARKYDLIHVHCLYKMIPSLRRLYPKKKIILHYHGIDCRLTPPKKRVKAEAMADKILLSTPDLKEFVPDGVYVPNPIDVELFSNETPKSDKAFTSLVRHHSKDLIEKYLKVNNFDLEFDVINTNESPIRYEDMPNFMSNYGTYIDLKFTEYFTLIPALSNTGRQALAKGLKVLNYELKYLTGLPPEHRPENVVANLEKIYAAI